MSFLSNRRYQIVMLEDTSNKARVEAPFQITLDQITAPTDDAEFIYALQDRGDEVLDLKVGESLYFQPIRDNNETKGIILRIK